MAELFPVAAKRKDNVGPSRLSRLESADDALPRSSYFRETSLIIEYKNLKYQSPPGVYVMPSVHSLYEWHGVIFVRKGIYRSGIFRFQIHIPNNYPAEGPRVKFSGSVFHPRIHPSGELDLSVAFPTWENNRDYLQHVLAYIQKIFYDVGSEVSSPANPVAAAMYLDARAHFLSQVQQCVERSNAESLFNEPGSSLRFSEYGDKHEAVRQRVLHGEMKRDSSGTLLWDFFKNTGGSADGKEHETDKVVDVPLNSSALRS